MNINAQTLNNLFLEKTASGEGLEELQLKTGTYIRKRLRERSFARRVLPPEYVKKSDCQRSVHHTGLVKIIDIEPDAAAMVVSFSGKGDHRYLRAERAEIPFFSIESERFEVSEEELMSWESPVTKILEDIQIKEIQYQVDKSFLTAVDAAIAGTGQSAAWSNASGIIDRAAIVSGLKLIDAQKLQVQTLLLCKETYDDILTWQASDIGHTMATEIVRDGYKYKSLLGHNLVVTINNDLVPCGTVYYFTEPRFAGKFYCLNPARFWLQKEGRHLSWWTWEDLGLALVNTKCCAKIYKQ